MSEWQPIETAPNTGKFWVKWTHDSGAEVWQWIVMDKPEFTWEPYRPLEEGQTTEDRPMEENFRYWSPTEPV